MEVISVVAYCLIALLYFWVLYNTPILAIGLRHMRRADSQKKRQKAEKHDELPMVSIVVPARDEENVIERLLIALTKIDYPREKEEVIIVEDASKDKTAEICRNYAEKYPELIRFFHRDVSTGKPSALNYGFKQAKGEIVAVFDADNVPEPDVLMQAVRYFEDPSVAAVQGTTCAINADQNMLTKFISYEEAVWLGTFLQGKDALNLFVPLTGSCQFIRRAVAEKIGFWDEDCLAEDLEMSARIIEQGYKVRYAPDAVSWQEAPSKMSHLIKQRVRWFRGYMEVAMKYGRFLKKLERKKIDAEITLMGPYVLASFILSYALSVYISVFPIYDDIFAISTEIMMCLSFVTLAVAGIALMYVTKPIRPKNVLWLPFIYAYWSLQCVLTSYAFLQMVFRRPKRWMKTEKTGRVTKSVA